jgi:REP element-mobilizing transposase RayT
MSQTLTNLLVHLVFSTKERQPIIPQSHRERLHSYIGGIIRAEGAEPLMIGGTSDHVHAAIKMPATQAVSDLVRVVKANSSKWANDSRMSECRFAWQNGYGAFSVSASQIGKVRAYIGRQVEHHRTTTFKEELLALLTKHGMEHDPRHLWD